MYQQYKNVKNFRVISQPHLNYIEAAYEHKNATFSEHGADSPKMKYDTPKYHKKG